MAGIACSRTRPTPRCRPPNARQAGQVLLDAIIATALLSLSLPVVAGTARALASRAQELHRELLIAIERENECAFAKASACGD